MPFWTRLFAPKPPPEPEGHDHKGFRITPRPIREGGQFRVAARIEKGGRAHDLVRADTASSLDDANALSLAKARQMIDEQGEGLFG